MYRIFIVAWGKPKQENRSTKMKWLLTEHHAPEISEDTVLRVQHVNLGQFYVQAV